MKSQNKNTESTTTKQTAGPSNNMENFDSQMSEWSLKIEEFKNKITDLSTILQTEASEKVEELEKKYSVASEKMADLKSKGLQAKDEMKTGFEKAWKELSQAYEAARKTFH